MLPPQAITPPAFAAQVKADYLRWGEFIKAIGFTIDA